VATEAACLNGNNLEKRRNKEEERKKRQNERKDLTLTGLLMEGPSAIPHWYTVSVKISETTSHDVRTVFVALALTLPLLIVACDPGVTIRQADSRTESGKRSTVILHVKSTHEFIGTTWYAPQVTVTNTSEAPVLVTGIELATKQKVYSDSSPRPQDFPEEVLSRQARNFTVLFRLDDAVYKTFRESAELRVHYRYGSSEDTARTAIVLGSLHDSP
jgi:hypothetical protein